GGWRDEAAIGTVTSLFYSAAHDSPENKAYVAAFEKANGGMRSNQAQPRPPWLLGEEVSGHGEDLVRRPAGAGDCGCRRRDVAQCGGRTLWDCRRNWGGLVSRPLRPHP